MTGSGPDLGLLQPGAPVDLTNCEREPIHVPGSVQPRGVLLAVREPDLVVTQVSANLPDLLGVPVADALGRRLTDVLGVVSGEAVARSAAAFGDLRERNPVELTLDVAGSPVPVDAILHRLGGGPPVGEVCDEVVARLLPAGGEDDVALVAVRLRGQSVSGSGAS
ncbi:hypothetical protein [Geodermatophilus marinus]|uniref:hypothetical protein n=1 Tax=Geodermatophilus sp. LHW52908 TaxID=2303986 RepID=UPI000E3E6439|nr:hypothetical protein [Geodermatophilus sp. LHW52908]RFU20362.1 hypothetical protein D0Z06_16610 [Geodermatophilus sp. LHW52908]